MSSSSIRKYLLLLVAHIRENEAGECGKQRPAVLARRQARDGRGPDEKCSVFVNPEDSFSIKYISQGGDIHDVYKPLSQFAAKHIMPATFVVNGRSVKVDVPDDTPLLWVLRDDLKLTGTKFGCGIGMCGACTVHLNGKAIRSCVTPLSSAVGNEVTTIEGLKGHPLQKSWIETQAPQCGYCQSGQIMQAASLLNSNPDPSDADINNSMNGNLCRCMAYVRIRKAIRMASASMRK